MFTVGLYICAGLGLVISLCKDRKKTKQALKKAWKSFENILPQFLTVLLLISVVLGVVDSDTIGLLLGNSSGIVGMLGAAIVGSITLIPGFVAFPLVSILLENGAGVMQLATFVSSLMMVGIMTYPMEVTTFGKKAPLLRNCCAFVFSIFVGLVMGVVL